MTRQLNRLRDKGVTLESEQEAIDLVNEAHDYATRIHAVTNVQELKPTPRMPSGSNPPRGAPAPKSTQDAMISALEGYRPAASR